MIGKHGLILTLMSLCLFNCGEKKTDVELFQNGKVRLDMSSSTRKGYSPLDVNFSAYLETKDTVYSAEITEVKWLIKGPNGLRQEIVGATQNFQDEEETKEDFFSFDHTFRMVGRYQVQLVLNQGEFKSRPVSVDVGEHPENRRN